MQANINSNKKERGAVVILLSVIVTSLVMIITAIAAESFKKYAGIADLQKKSLEELYKAEEGIEYSLYVNKEKIYTPLNFNLNATSSGSQPFYLSSWEGNGNTNAMEGNIAQNELTQTTIGRNIAVISESVSSSSQAKRSLFTTLPSRYYDQLTLWNSMENCGGTLGDCEIKDSPNDMENEKDYEVVIDTAIYNNTGWETENVEYRVNFNCGYYDSNCEISNFSIALDCGANDFLDCPIDTPETVPEEKCNIFKNDIGMAEYENTEGGNLQSEWFVVKDSNGNTVDLRGKRIIIDFTLLNGPMEEVCEGSCNNNNNDNETVEMCKKTDSQVWQKFTGRRGGVSGLEIRKKKN